MSDEKKCVELVNKDYGKMLKPHLLEQYKLFVKTSMDVTEKRQEANKFHLTFNSVVFGLSSGLTILNQNLVIILLSLVGILISFVWRMNILAFKELNKGKFKVIHELENYLPARLFRYEEVCYLNKYHGLTSSEKYYPIIFIILYLGLIVFTVINAGWLEQIQL